MEVFVGYDSREDIAYQVCRHSILRHQPHAEVIPLKLSELRDKNLYWRPEDSLGSTEFTFSRFLVPHLSDYKGWAVFVDCDFLWEADIKELFDLADDQYAVMVVQHDYNPTNTVKMDGKSQHLYPRKNWSSMILWNCGHPSNRVVTPELVNSETGAFLHRFQWLKDEEIGSISHEWNWLVNWYKEPENGKPKAIHYTEGGPWFENYFHCEYGANWEREKLLYEEDYVVASRDKKFLYLPEEIKSIIEKLIQYRVDPKNQYYTASKEEIFKDIEMVNSNKVVAAIEAIEGEKHKMRGIKYDPILENFIMGVGGQITIWDKTSTSLTPVALRGLGKRKQIKECWATGRDFYYIDTGYFGNDRKKNYHRITKNNLQNIGPVIHRPRDRLSRTGITLKKFRPGKNILLCPPSEKVMKFFDLDLQTWILETVDTIKKYTDRPIIIREKQARSVRVTTDTMEMALANNVHCLVTFNSIAATEALLSGKPAFTLGPNAAQSLCSSDLSKIEKPFIPHLDEVEEWAAHLAYCQFTELEMMDGTAWRILNETP